MDAQIKENDTFLDKMPYWSKILLIYLIVQAVLGVLALSFAWSRTQRFRNIIEKRDGKYPAFRRTDVQNWSFCKFLPGAIFTMPTRIILLSICGCTIALIASILSIGHNFQKDGPMKNGCRKNIYNFRK